MKRPDVLHEKNNTENEHSSWGMDAVLPQGVTVLPLTMAQFETCPLPAFLLLKGYGQVPRSRAENS